jgi:hypothetical protein
MKMMNKAVVGNLILLFALCSQAFAQTEQQDSVRNMVFEALVRNKPLITGTLTSQIKNTSWEALAYWDNQTPRKIEHMMEAVGDIYQFKVNEFVLELRNPDEAGGYLKPITGGYVVEGNKIKMSNATGASLVAVVYYLDANYLVFDLDGLRIFLVKIKVNASK